MTLIVSTYLLLNCGMLLAYIGILYESTYGATAGAACAGTAILTDPEVVTCVLNSATATKTVCTTGQSDLPVLYTTGYVQVFKYETSNCSGTPSSVVTNQIGGCFQGTIVSSVVVDNYMGTLTSSGTDGKTCSISTEPVVDVYPLVCSAGVYATWSASASVPVGTSITTGYLKQTSYSTSSTNIGNDDEVILPCSGAVSSEAFIVIGTCFNGMEATLLNTSTNELMFVLYGFDDVNCTNNATFFYKQLLGGQCVDNSITSHVPSMTNTSGSGQQAPVGYLQSTTYPAHYNCQASPVHINSYTYPGHLECSSESYGSSSFEVLISDSTIIQNYAEYSNSQCAGVPSLATISYTPNGQCENNAILTIVKSFNVPELQGIMTSYVLLTIN